MSSVKTIPTSCWTELTKTVRSCTTLLRPPTTTLTYFFRQSFFPFANGILDDLQTVKGIMGVKINIGSTLPNKILWIFTAHLQSDPSDDKDLHLVKTTRIQQVEACLRFVTKTLVCTFQMSTICLPPFQNRPADSVTFLLSPDSPSRFRALVFCHNGTPRLLSTV